MKHPKHMIPWSIYNHQLLQYVTHQNPAVFVPYVHHQLLVEALLASQARPSRKTPWQAGVWS